MMTRSLQQCNSLHPEGIPGNSCSRGQLPHSGVVSAIPIVNDTNSILEGHPCSTLLEWRFCGRSLARRSPPSTMPSRAKEISKSLGVERSRARHALNQKHANRTSVGPQNESCLWGRNEQKVHKSSEFSGWISSAKPMQTFFHITLGGIGAKLLLQLCQDQAVKDLMLLLSAGANNAAHAHASKSLFGSTAASVT
eukprot:78932-Amphidinium_carterae.2